MWSRFDSDGWPRSTPRIITKYGVSAFSGRAESELPSALLTADIAGQWLSLGGNAAYMFGYPSNWPATDKQACAGYGNMMLFMADDAGQAAQPLPNYFAARVLSRAWTQPGGGPHRVIPSAIEGATDQDLAAFALHRPDGRISVLLVNRSAAHAHAVSLREHLAPGALNLTLAPSSITVVALDRARIGPARGCDDPRHGNLCPRRAAG